MWPVFLRIASRRVDRRVSTDPRTWAPGRGRELPGGSIRESWGAGGQKGRPSLVKKTEDRDRLPHRTTCPPGLPGHVIGTPLPGRSELLLPFPGLGLKWPWIDLLPPELSFCTCESGPACCPGCRGHEGQPPCTCAVPASWRPLPPDRGLQGRDLSLPPATRGSTAYQGPRGHMKTPGAPAFSWGRETFPSDESPRGCHLQKHCRVCRVNAFAGTF